MSARSLDINGKMNQGNITVHKLVCGGTSVYLHGNKVFSISGNDEIILSSCGWRTPTTKTAINNCLKQVGYEGHIFQEKGSWYFFDYKAENQRTLFIDNMTIKAGV